MFNIFLNPCFFISICLLVDHVYGNVGSCHLYGHSCLGAHGKRDEILNLPSNPVELTSQTENPEVQKKATNLKQIPYYYLEQPRFNQIYRKLIDYIQNAPYRKIESYGTYSNNMDLDYKNLMKKNYNSEPTSKIKKFSGQIEDNLDTIY